MSRKAICFALFSGLVAATASAQDAAARRKGVRRAEVLGLPLRRRQGQRERPARRASAAKLSADDIRAWIVDAKGMTAKTKAARKPEMKAYTLPKDDVDALVAYLPTLKKK